MNAKHKFGNFNNTYVIVLNGTDYNNTTTSERGQICLIQIFIV
jgi:hypothetical protein